MTILPLNCSIIFYPLSLVSYNQMKPNNYHLIEAINFSCSKRQFGGRKESEELESESVKMESRGKLSNDEKVKFVCI